MENLFYLFQFISFSPVQSETCTSPTPQEILGEEGRWQCFEKDLFYAISRYKTRKRWDGFPLPQTKGDKLDNKPTTATGWR